MGTAYVGASTRKTPRVSCGLPARAQARSGVLRGVVRTLSRGGLFFLTPAALRVGTLVDMQIEIPYPKAVRAMGQVCYRHKYAEGAGLGIRFVSVTDDDLGVIARYVDEKIGLPAQ